MFNKLKRLISVTLAFVLAFSLLGCTKSTSVTSYVEYVIEDDNSSEQNNNSSTNSSIDNTANNSSASSENVSSDAISSDDTTEEVNYCGVTIKFAVTSDPANSEKAPVIKSFEEKYGIKVEPVIISGDFITELCGLIANGESPDVVRSSGDFPLSLSYLQSLDAAKLDYSDPIWAQGMFDLTTFNGSPYLCTTVGNVYAETDIVVYRKDILSAAGCKTPEQYDAEGNWNMDAFFEIGRICAQKNDKVIGCSFVNYDSAIHMSGNSVFKLQNGKFINGFKNSAIDIFTQISDNKQEGIVTINATKGIVDGTVAITTHHSYALRKTGAFENYKEVWNKLGYYYLPNVDDSSANLKTGICRGWGLVKGAANPIPAGLFLRYYLDPANFDIDDMYISPEAGTFFLRATDIDYENWYPYFTYGEKTEGIAGIDFYDDIYSNVSLNKTQFAAKFSGINSKIDSACENLNKYVTNTINQN